MDGWSQKGTGWRKAGDRERRQGEREAQCVDGQRVCRGVKQGARARKPGGPTAGRTCLPKRRRCSGERRPRRSSRIDCRRPLPPSPLVGRLGSADSDLPLPVRVPCVPMRNDMLASHARGAGRSRRASLRRAGRRGDGPAEGRGLALAG